MNPITRLLSEELIQALGWTILHSFWQGLGVALLLMVSMLLLRRHTPQLRYLFGLGSMLLIVVLAVSTFFYLYLPAASQLDTAAASGQSFAGPHSAITAPGAADVGLQRGWKAIAGQLSAFLGQHMPWLVAIWILGIFMLTLRVLGELAVIQQLRYNRSRPVDGKWEAMLCALAGQLGIKKKVELRESLRINTPMVLGIWRPLILLPVGLVSGFSPRQVESILAHELAHIRRHDYLANLLQTLAEIVLFFNPAVWWISSLIRIEREHCCDDIAVDLTGDAVTFVKTLATLEEYRHTHTGLAIGFTGNKGSLLSRIQRLAGTDYQSNLPFRFFWSAIIMLMVMLGLAFTKPEQEAFSLQAEKEEVSLALLPSNATIMHPAGSKADDSHPELVVVSEPDTIPKENKKFEEERARLEQEYRARMLELERMVSDLQRQEEKIKISAELEHRAREKELLELEKQVQQMASRREMEAKDREIELVRVSARIADAEVELQGLRSELSREMGKKKPDDKKIQDMETRVEKLTQEKLELEKEVNARNFEGQKGILELEKERHALLNDRIALEKDLQIQLFEQQTEALELQQQAREVQMQMEIFNHDFQLKLLELERRFRKMEE